MSDIYYAPEKFDLTTMGEVDFSDGCYCFDYTVAWRRNSDGQLFYGDDAGCSCPSPFETFGIGDLTPCTPAELQLHLEERNNGNYDGDRSAQILELMAKVTS